MQQQGGRKRSTSSAGRAGLADQLSFEKSDEGRIKKRVRVGKTKEEIKKDYIASKTSKQILSQARAQLNEGDEDKDEENENNNSSTTFDFSALKAEDMDDSQSVMTDMMSETASAYMADLQVDEEDEKMINMFIAAKPKNLTSAIAKKILPPPSSEPDLKPEIAALYRKVGHIMQNLKNDKLPKAMTILPSLKNWEQLLFLTSPEKWCPRGMLLMTRLFTKNREKMAQRFYNVVLLPAVRDNIIMTKVLHQFLYLALKKALWNIAAWFKGILLPLCEEGDCSLREAVMIGRALKRTHLSPIHASVAILKLSQLPYSPSTSHFLLVLLDKGYALPYRVIDSVAEHFAQFLEETGPLPVLWHQSLLVFVRRYKADITPNQKKMLTELLRMRPHKVISPEIRELLINSKSRGENTTAQLQNTKEVEMKEQKKEEEEEMEEEDGEDDEEHDDDEGGDDDE